MKEQIVVKNFDDDYIKEDELLSVITDFIEENVLTTITIDFLDEDLKYLKVKDKELRWLAKARFRAINRIKLRKRNDLSYLITNFITKASKSETEILYFHLINS
jgi:hypothetical protein